METLKCETMLNEGTKFFIKVIFSYTTMSRKNSKQESQSIITIKIIIKLLKAS